MKAAEAEAGDGFGEDVDEIPDEEGEDHGYNEILAEGEDGEDEGDEDGNGGGVSEFHKAKRSGAPDSGRELEGMREEFAGGELLALLVAGEEAENGEIPLEALAQFGDPLTAGTARGKGVLEGGLGIGGGGAEEEGGNIGQAVG